MIEGIIFIMCPSGARSPVLIDADAIVSYKSVAADLFGCVASSGTGIFDRGNVALSVRRSKVVLFFSRANFSNFKQLLRYDKTSIVHFS